MPKSTTTKKTATTSKKVAPKRTAKKATKVAPKRTAKKATKVVTKRNAVLVLVERAFPTNCQRVDRAVSAELKSKGMKSHKGIQFIMKKRTEKNGVNVLGDWEPISKAVAWKNKVMAVLKKRTLDLTVKGSQVLPVSQVDVFTSEMNDLSREADDIKQELIDILPQIKQEDLERLRSATDANGNPVDLSHLYDEALYPTPARIQGYGIRSILTPLDADAFPENASSFEEAEGQKVDRLVESFGSMFKSILDYVNGDAKKFTENSIENAIEEAGLLKEFDLGGDTTSFNKVCDQVIEIANKVNAPAIRQAWANVNKGTAKDEAVEADAKKFLDDQKTELEKSLEDLSKACEGLV